MRSRSHRWEAVSQDTNRHLSDSKAQVPTGAGRRGRVWGWKRQVLSRRASGPWRASLRARAHPGLVSCPPRTQGEACRGRWGFCCCRTRDSSCLISSSRSLLAALVFHGHRRSPASAGAGLPLPALTPQPRGGWSQGLRKGGSLQTAPPSTPFALLAPDSPLGPGLRTDTRPSAKHGVGREGLRQPQPGAPARERDQERVG